jgi:hypothetical protein
VNTIMIIRKNRFVSGGTGRRILPVVDCLQKRRLPRLPCGMLLESTMGGDDMVLNRES